jgi:hypothetical protein
VYDVGFMWVNDGDGLWGVWGGADAEGGDESIYDFKASKGNVLRIMSAKLSNTLEKTEGRRRDQ